MQKRFIACGTVAQAEAMLLRALLRELLRFDIDKRRDKSRLYKLLFRLAVALSHLSPILSRLEAHFDRHRKIDIMSVKFDMSVFHFALDKIAGIG